MSEKTSCVDPAVKVQLVERYLKGEIGATTALKLAGLSTSGLNTFYRWVNIYRNEGPTGLLRKKKKQRYSKELKLTAVLAYLNGEGTLSEITGKYGIRSDTDLRRWLKEYNTHGEIKSRESEGGSFMRKAKKTTYDERNEIVQYCLANGKNYGAAAEKYQCSYQQVRNWVKRYEEMGPAGLEDRRGKRIGELPARTPEEELRDRIAKLKQENLELQMENDLLKKVRELEMKDRSL